MAIAVTGEEFIVSEDIEDAIHGLQIKNVRRMLAASLFMNHSSFHPHNPY